MGNLTHSVVVPVYNSPHHVRVALASLAGQGEDVDEIIVVDDSSGPQTNVLLDQAEASAQNLKVVTHETNQGYLASANHGISQASGDIITLANSDTLVPHGVFRRIAESFRSTADLGALTGVSTWSNLTQVPFPPGENVWSLAERIGRFGGNQLLDIGSASGFFFSVRRDTYAELGTFDPIYDRGYWEETDFCMRVLANGLSVKVDPAMFVFHYGWGSFASQGRNHFMERNRPIFRQRWGERYDAVMADVKQRDPLSLLKKNLEEPRGVSASPDGRVIVLSTTLGQAESQPAAIDLARRLVLAGVDVTLASTEPCHPSNLYWEPVYAQPQFVDAAEILDLPPAAIVISTDPESQSLARVLVACGRAAKRIHCGDLEDTIGLIPEVAQDVGLSPFATTAGSMWPTIDSSDFSWPPGGTPLARADSGTTRLTVHVGPDNWEASSGTTAAFLSHLAEHLPQLQIRAFSSASVTCTDPRISWSPLVHKELADDLAQADVFMDLSRSRISDQLLQQARDNGILRILSRASYAPGKDWHGTNCVIVEGSNMPTSVDATRRMLAKNGLTPQRSTER